MSIILTALLLQGGAAMSATREHCAVRIEFGSYSGGTDGKLARDIDGVLKARPNLKVKRIGGRGIEGEYDLCVQTASAAGAREVYAVLRTLIPKYTKVAPTTVRLASGESFGSTWPPTAQLVRTPSRAVMEEAFPSTARRLGVTWGSAILDCTVMPSGAFETCTVVNEFPEGAGFGAAALTLAKHYRLGFPPDAERITRTRLSVRLPPIE